MMMAMVMLTSRRCMERGACQAVPYWRVVGGGRRGVPGLAEGDGEVGSGGKEECEGVVGASVVGFWH
jgi:hypothetical protein